LTTKTDEESSDLMRVDRTGAETEASVSAQASTEPAQVQAQAEVQTAPAAEPQREPVGAITGEPERTEAAPMPERTAEPAPAPEREESARTDLPNTAGLLPLLALIGLGSIVGSRLLRRARTQQL
jgi:hypothetical protein